METHEDYYSLKGTVQNLMLLKLAYDNGVDVKQFPDYVTNFDFGAEYDWDIFLRTVESLFTIVECWGPYSGEDDVEDKAYWCHAADFKLIDESQLDSWGILVLLDDRIEHSKVPAGSLGGGIDFYSGFAEIMPLEKGVVVIWDEDDGPVNLVEILYVLIEILQT
ncbi:hypothetical protein C0966_17250 (plasmid) [Bacillus methanolicus]|uniref:hypothetical protein n=1 Tax=Bacillus methanolicus TaxID=1471 RepID=UPI00237FDDF8|nr:hypothetical protein [Bacillus methanolicus]MDE3841013.1 hypothetical protein [Bacillus methanolicus]